MKELLRSKMYPLDRRDVGSIRMKYFFTHADYFYYELFLFDGDISDKEDVCRVERHQSRPILKIVDDLSPARKNTIQFIYKNKVLKSRQLSDYEVNKLLDIIRGMKFHVDMKPENMIMIDPDIESIIFLETDQVTVKYSWMTSDELSNPRKMREIKKLTEILSVMLNIDYSQLDMPVYL